MAEPFQVFRLWKRLVETRVLTEDGAYAEGQVPEDYGGPELKIKITQRAILTDNAGHLLELRMDDLNDVKDKDNNTGLGLNKVTVGTLEVEYAAAGPSAEKVTWALEENTTLPEAVRARANQMYELYVAQDLADE